MYIVCILLIPVTSKNRTRLAAASDKVYQLLAHGRCHHDIAEILLKVV